MAPSTDVKALACQDINNDTLVHPHDSCDQHFVDKHGKSGYRPLLKVGKVDGGREQIPADAVTRSCASISEQLHRCAKHELGAFGQHAAQNLSSDKQSGWVITQLLQQF